MKTQNARSPESGLFWRALRAPEWERASKEFNGAFTHRARGTAFFLSALVFLLSAFVLFSLLREVIALLWAAIDPPNQSVWEFLLKLAVFYMLYVAFSALYALAHFIYFNPCNRIFRPPIPGDHDALNSRTAIRLLIVHFARYLRRLIFPWEWYSGQP